MSEHNKTKNETQEYLINPLEDGEPIYDYTVPGSRVNLTEEFNSALTGTALVKLSDGRTVAVNRRAMALLRQPDSQGNYSKSDHTAGVVIAEQYPDGLPEAEIGSTWIGMSGRVERVALRPGYPCPRQPVPEGVPTPGINRFETAEAILRDFEAAQVNAQP